MTLPTRNGSFNPRPAVSCGATKLPTQAPTNASFQSAPRSLLRGDTYLCGYTVFHGKVSIRAPQSPAGRLGSSRPTLVSLDVSIRAPQSPAGRRKGTSVTCRIRNVSIRAPQSPAGRQGLRLGRVDYDGFNPRPAVSCGATILAQLQTSAGLFQSAPRSLLRGDQISQGFVVAVTQFQSAPRSLLRGDLPSKLLNPSEAWFQSAPRSLLRGDAAGRAGRRPRPGRFNPRPAVSCGATPIWKAELIALQFQSAPRSLLRGDLRHGSTFGHRSTRFNPRPAVSCGATAT